MVKPLRIEFAGAVSNITSTGNAKEDIFKDDSDKKYQVDQDEIG